MFTCSRVYLFMIVYLCLRLCRVGDTIFWTPNGLPGFSELFVFSELTRFDLESNTRYDHRQWTVCVRAPDSDRWITCQYNTLCIIVIIASRLLNSSIAFAWYGLSAIQGTNTKISASRTFACGWKILVSLLFVLTQSGKLLSNRFAR